MSNSKKMNEEFESWRKLQIASLIRTGHIDAAKAFEGFGSIHWMAWQCAWNAALDSVVIELPDIKNTFYPNTTERARAEEAVWWCKTRIIDAGLKVKP